MTSFTITQSATGLGVVRDHQDALAAIFDTPEAAFRAVRAAEALVADFFNAKTGA